MTTLDEQKLIDKLPRYVIDNPDRIPSQRLFEGDMKLLLDKVNKIENSMGGFYSRLAAMSDDVNQFAKFIDPGKMRSTMQAPMPVSFKHVNVEPARAASCSVVGNSTHTPLMNIVQSAVSAPTTGAANNNSDLRQSQPLSVNWSDRIIQSDTGDSDTDGFTVVQRRKRRRDSPSTPTTTPAVSNQTNRKQHIIVGKQQSNSTVSTLIKAAKPTAARKSVFCIDNIDKSVSLDDMLNFITSMNINVLSLYEAKPRRRKNEAPVVNRKAFRLCIDQQDQNRLLDENAWPSYVTVSNWFFKPKSTTTDDNTPHVENENVSEQMDANEDTNTDTVNADIDIPEHSQS